MKMALDNENGTIAITTERESESLQILQYDMHEEDR
jgi:hypothetical protein